MINGRKVIQFKIVVLGDRFVGKIDFYNRTIDVMDNPQIHKIIDPNLFFSSSVGVNPFIISKIDGENKINYNFWVISSNKRLKIMYRNFLGSSVVGLVFFDPYNRATFDSIENWVKTIREYSQESIIGLISSIPRITSVVEPVIPKEIMEKVNNLNCEFWLEINISTGEYMADILNKLRNLLISKT